MVQKELRIRLFQTQESEIIFAMSILMLRACLGVCVSYWL